MSDFRTYLSEEYPPRSGCCRGAIALLASIAFIALVVLCNSCATEKCIPQIEHVRHDSIVERWHRDTLIIHTKDSSSTKQKGDTVFVERWHYDYIYVSKKDSASSDTNDSSDIVQTETIKVVPDYYRYCTWAAWILLGIMLLYIAWRLFKKFYLKK